MAEWLQVYRSSSIKGGGETSTLVGEETSSVYQRLIIGCSLLVNSSILKDQQRLWIKFITFEIIAWKVKRHYQNHPTAH